MKIIQILILSVILMYVPCSRAQSEVQPVVLTLDDAVARARSRSVDAAVALNELRTAYWQYRTYRAELLPEVTFEATLPSYSKKYSLYQNQDGEFSFVRNNYMDIVGTLSVTQNIWATGGTLSINSQLDYMRQLSDAKYNRFMSIPVALTLNQPIFAANTVKWSRRIEPVRFEEAKAKFLSATEEVAMTTITYFFNLLSAREAVEIERQNLSNATRLLEVAKVKREMGRISGNDLLQMELNELTARSALTEAESNMKSHMFRLISLLDYGEGTLIEPVLPDGIPEVEVTYADALSKALERNKFSHNIRRRQLEADYEVAKAKGDRRRIDLYAQVGFTGVGTQVRDAYSPLKDNQVVEIGVKIPILDWGKRAGKVKVAESNRQVVASRLRQESQNFSQDIFILVERFNNQRGQLALAARADEIARRRYDTNVETYLIGKISTLDLNDSQVKKDETRREYISELYSYWYYFYQLRSLTLWDYKTDTPLTADFITAVRGE
ncbi:MAG: TolC family protein [Muribaculaceae bacterium]|nr:TolC family protein [Muribaculaceae bacterium]